MHPKQVSLVWSPPRCEREETCSGYSVFSPNLASELVAEMIRQM